MFIPQDERDEQANGGYAELVAGSCAASDERGDGVGEEEVFHMVLFFAGIACRTKISFVIYFFYYYYSVNL